MRIIISKRSIQMEQFIKSVSKFLTGREIDKKILKENKRLYYDVLWLPVLYGVVLLYLLVLFYFGPDIISGNDTLFIPIFFILVIPAFALLLCALCDRWNKMFLLLCLIVFILSELSILSVGGLPLSPLCLHF